MESKNDDGRVGFKRPPKHTRFKPGQSGNPKGRAKHVRNLKTEFLPRRNDIILCRNVMIYFDEAEQKRLIDKFWHCLNPGGYLFVGHAESLFGLTQKFKMVHENNGTAYQRLEGKS